MPRLDLALMGRPFPVQCEEGDEPRVEALAGYVDRVLRQLAAAQSGASENRLLVLGCLQLADEIFDLKGKVASGGTATNGRAQEEPELESILVAAVDDLRGKLDRLAARLEA